MRFSILLFLAVAPLAFGESSFPKEWPVSTPEAQGLVAAKLEETWQELKQRHTDGFLVIRNDHVVYEGYANGFSRTKPHGTASLAKALVGGMSLMTAMNDGYITPDDKAAKYVPQWAGVDGKKDITVRELSTHTSGLDDAEMGDTPHAKLTGWQGDFWKQLPAPNDPFTIARDVTPMLFAPGTKENYSNPGMAMLGYCITASLRDAPQKNLRSLLKERILDPLGVPKEEWSIGYGATTNIDGLPIIATWGGAAFSPSAAARVGRLLMRKGDWDEHQLLKPEIVEAGTHFAGLPNHSGLGWWVNHNPDGSRPWPAVPEDAFWGLGAGEQTLIVIPSLNLIIVRNGQNMGSGEHGRDEVAKWVVLPVLAAFAKIAEAPYPPSPVIKEVVWAPKESIVRKAEGSDNWPLAWGDDDALYTAYGDGNGFEPFVPEKLSLGFAKITGGPENFVGANIRSETGEKKGNGRKGLKASGMVMVDGVLYLWVRNADNAQLAWSADHAATWTWSDWKLTKSFGCPTFVEYGRNYSDARDGYVYFLSPDAASAYDHADRLLLGRVVRGKVQERSEYEFFMRLDENGTPIWSRSIDEAGSAFTAPGACYRPRIAYDPALKRYLLNMTGPGSDTRFAGGFSIYDAPEPWGPWTTVFRTQSWDVGPGDSNSFPAKWLSADGRTAWLVFSNEDHFAVRKATFILGDGAARN